MMKDVTTSIRDIQDELLALFNEKTILIGHSLDSDLISLKVRLLTLVVIDLTTDLISI